MGIITPLKQRNLVRKVQYSIRHHQASPSTPSQQAFEANPREAYFWRR